MLGSVHPRQVARLSTDRCRDIETALILAGHLGGKTSTVELQYPSGGCWQVPTDDERFVIWVSARPLDASGWIIRIEPGVPDRPTVVSRTPPSADRMRVFARRCHDVALTLHRALRPLCPELRWETDDGDAAFVASPPPPVT